MDISYSQSLLYLTIASLQNLLVTYDAILRKPPYWRIQPHLNAKFLPRDSCNSINAFSCETRRETVTGFAMFGVIFGTKCNSVDLGYRDTTKNRPSVSQRPRVHMQWNNTHAYA